MGAVADICHRVYQDLRQRLDEIHATSTHLKADTDDLSMEVHGTSIRPSTDTLDDVIRSETDADQHATFLVDFCSPDANGWPVADKLDDELVSRIYSSFHQLSRIDQLTRDSLQRLAADKNDMAARSLALLGDISSLQSDYAELAATLANFREDLGSNRVDAFRHLVRLNNMLWAYGATFVEVIRRKEFTRHFLAKSQTLAELMAKVSARERKRRTKFRTEVAAQLPWEVKGMDEAPPSLEISTSSRADDSGAAPDLDRQDLKELMQLFADVESAFAQADAISGDSTAHVLKPTKEAVTHLIARIDTMDDEFADLVEEYLLRRQDEEDEGSSADGGRSQSSDGTVVRKRRRRRLASTAASAVPNSALAAERESNVHLQQELQHLMQQIEKRERSDYEKHQAELNALRVESSHARAEARKLKDDLDGAKREAAASKTELETLKSDATLETERRINMQGELSSLRTEAQVARKEEAQARREATEESERLAEVEVHLNDLQTELEEAKAARTDASDRIERLLSEGSNVEKELFSAQEKIQDLHAQVEAARHDARYARDALAEAEAARERVIRSHRAEADSDRAILEERLRELELELNGTRSEMQRIKDNAKLDTEAAQTLRSQLRGADEAHEELVKAMESAKDASAEAELSRRHAEREAEMLLEMARPLLERMLAIKKHVDGLPTLSSSRRASTGGVATSGQTPAEQASTRSVASIDGEELEASRQAAIEAFLASPTDADSAATLNALRSFSASQACDETIKKLDLLVTLVRKWQKTYKRQASEASAKMSVAVRDRIAFRNFAIGDLALFLPSRNNALDPKPWAAFNISFPHFFLNAPAGSLLAEQLRSKEWIVARIVQIDERVADSSGSATTHNPFQLAPGTKFCLLDVDGWNPNSPVVTRPRPKARGLSEPDTVRRSSQQASQSSTAPLESPLAHKTSVADTDSPSKRPGTMRSLTGAVAQRGDSEGQNGIDGGSASIGDSMLFSAPAQEASGSDAEETGAADVVTAPPSAALVTANDNASGTIAEQSSTDTAMSMGSGLTRAMRAAASRSPSTSRAIATVRLPNGNNEDKTRRSIGASTTNSQSALDSSAAPAFGGIRGRRRGWRHGLSTSTATSPGAENKHAALSAPSMSAMPSPIGRAAELTYEAVNPFSQSPAGNASSWGGGQPVASIPKTPQTNLVRKTSTTGRSPSMASVSKASGFLTLSGSPTAQAVAMAVPVQAEASLTQARGETTGAGSSSLGSGDGSGFSVRTQQSMGKSPMGNAGSGGTPSSGSTASFFSMSRTLGRRTSVTSKSPSSGLISGSEHSRRPTSMLFGQAPSRRAAETSTDDGEEGGASQGGSGSASQLLKRLSEAGGGGR